MQVAVLGGGNGGHATAADLTLAGHGVRYWLRDDRAIDALRAAGGITLEAEGRAGRAVPAVLTADIGEAVRGAGVIVVALPATAHEDVARRLAPHLGEGHIVLLTPGTFGAYAMARDVERLGGRRPFAYAETGTLPYLARTTGPAAVRAPVRAANLPAGVFPASRSKETLARVGDLFAAVRPCADVLDAALTNAGPVIHPPLVLLNAGAIDRGPFDVHAAGTTASVRRLMEAVDAERVAARRAWGYPAPHYELATYYDTTRAADGLYGAGARARLEQSGLWNETLTFEHRYVQEDAALGLTLLESAARTVTLDSPATSGLLLVFGALLGRTLAGRGRDLAHLGLGDLFLREVRALLHDGWQSPHWSRALR